MHTIQELQALAKAAHASKLIPGGLNEDQMLMVMMAGQEMGLPPMTALQKINILHGRMVPSAEAMAAAIISAGHQIITKERTNERCVLVGIRKGETVEHEHVFSREDAAKAGLGGQQYQKRPSVMFYNRCLTQLARAVFPDCIGGMSYGEDEVEEIEASKRKGRKGTPTMEGADEWVADAKAVMERIYAASPEFGQKADQAIYSQHGATLDHLGGRANRDEILAQITAWADEAEAREAKAAEPAESGEQPSEAPEAQGAGELPLEDVSGPDLGGHRDPA